MIVIVASLLAIASAAQTVFGSSLGLGDADKASPSLLDAKAVAKWAPALQQMAVVDGEQQIELPVLDPSNIDPRLLVVCDNVLSADDIYTGLMAVMARVEDAWRRASCDQKAVEVHTMPLIVHTLLGRLEPLDLAAVRRHPVVGTYVDTMAAKARELVAKAATCTLDYALLTKVVRMTLKMLVNRATCAQIQTDVLRGRAGLSPLYNSAVRPSMPSTSAPPLADGAHEPYPYSRLSAGKDIGAATEDAPNKWPFNPKGYEPVSPLQGAVSPGGSPYNGVANTSCGDCAKAVDVIAEPGPLVRWD